MRAQPWRENSDGTPREQVRTSGQPSVPVDLHRPRMILFLGGTQPCGNSPRLPLRSVVYLGLNNLHCNIGVMCGGAWLCQVNWVTAPLLERGSSRAFRPRDNLRACGPGQPCGHSYKKVILSTPPLTFHHQHPHIQNLPTPKPFQLFNFPTFNTLHTSTCPAITTTRAVTSRVVVTLSRAAATSRATPSRVATSRKVTSSRATSSSSPRVVNTTTNSPSRVTSSRAAPTTTTTSPSSSPSTSSSTAKTPTEATTTSSNSSTSRVPLARPRRVSVVSWVPLPVAPPVASLATR